MNRSVLKLLLFSTITLVLSAGAAGYALYQQDSQGRQLRSAMEGLESWVHLNRARVNLDSEANANASDRERLRALVLDDQNDTITFLAHIDQLGQEVGVRVGTHDLKSDRTSEAGFDEIVTTLSLGGRTEAVERMVALLEVLPYRSRIERLTLTRGGGEAEATVVLRVSILE